MMNQEDIFKKIGQILNELNDQYQYLAQNPRELNELELELFLANASFLSDHVNIIKKINSGVTPRILSGDTEAKHHNHIGDDSSVHEILPAKPHLDDIFKPDNEPSNFEFILNEKLNTDKFEFEEKPVDAIFDRPLSKEEELIIAQKQKLREMDSLGVELPEDDEVGPEPFLVSEQLVEAEAEEIETVSPVEEETTAVAEEEKQETGHTVHENTAAQEPAEEEIIAATQPVAETSVPVTAHIPVIEHIQEEIIEEPAGEPEPVADYKPEPVREPAPVFESKPVQEELFAPVQGYTDKESEKPAARPTLNDILSGGNTARNINTESSRVQIKDLKQAISLNDKMRYIKDLFNGYNLAYAEAIDLVNKMPDFKSADEFLQRNYAVKNNWAAKQDTTDQFYELLNQRFSVK
ncbi:hypothetical protein TH53_14925 [Pedobacter lusitanus]|uniref:Uncharacterized protein n=1 Tax=Pedobacter lusitanus TaxID=1503925 RepID=A0A0D0GPK7_9SPHI|nr:hypothetical protein [Pedobacter lusitanus]KIO76431.1 hypothetical protein TH53_14925 [Pedobacter lusitanus]